MYLAIAGGCATPTGVTDSQTAADKLPPLANCEPRHEPEPRVRVAPVYPAKARSQKLEGYVTVRFTVTENGAIMNPIVIQSEPIGIFESALLDSMHKWQYWPRVVDCERVDTEGVESTISFMVEQ